MLATLAGNLRHAYRNWNVKERVARHGAWLEGNQRGGMRIIDVGCGIGGPMRNRIHLPRTGQAAGIFRNPPHTEAGSLVLGPGDVPDGQLRPRQPRHHQAIKKDLMQGIALREIATFPQVNRALEAAGFEILEAADKNTQDAPSTPWHQPMEARHGTAGCFGITFREVALAASPNRL